MRTGGDKIISCAFLYETDLQSAAMPTKHILTFFRAYA